MKKDYLISLLGLAAISVSLGNGFSSTPLFANKTSSESSTNASNLSDEELNTIEKYSSEDEYFGWSIEEVSMGNKSSAAIINDDEGNDHLYTWGYNNYGQLGLGDDALYNGKQVQSFNTPQEVTDLPEGDMEQISMGEDFAGVLIDGQIWTWGHNNWGQLGSTTANSEDITGSEPHNYPFLVDVSINGFANKNIEQISMGDCFVMAVQNDETSGNDTLWSWGHNDQGQLGQGTGGDDWWDSNPYPTKAVNLPEGDIEQITTGHDFASAVVNDQLYTWGYNEMGQLGYTPDDYPSPISPVDDHEEIGSNNITPTLVPDDETGSGFVNTNINQVSTGVEHSAILLDDNSFYTWGCNEYGELGLGSASESEDHFHSPQRVTTLPEGEIEQISMGSHASGVVVENELYTWGNNKYGQLGLGNYTDTSYNTPQPVTNLPSGDIKQIVMEDDQSGALVDNNFYTWGRNDYGQLGLGIDGDPQPSPEHVDNDMPYLINTWSAPQATSAGSKTIDIEYGFQTNIINWHTTPTVTTHVYGGEEEIIANSTLNPPTESYKLYTGTQEITIPDDDLYGEFTYEMDLNYIDTNDDQDENGTVKTISNFISGDFVLKAETQKPEINQVGTIEPDSLTEASVEYKVPPGATDAYGNPLTLKEVSWIDKEAPIDNNVLDSSTSGELSGELSSSAFKASETYNTELVARYENANGQSVETIGNVNSFTMLQEPTETTVVQEKAPYRITKTGAKVDYKIELGKDNDGEDVEITEVRWMNGGDTLATDTSGKTTGTLKTNALITNTPYDNTTIEVDVDGKGACLVVPAEVDSFTTKSSEEASTIATTSDVELISATSAEVSYEVTPGKDKDGHDVTVKKVNWIDQNDNNKIIATTSGNTGTLKAQGLEPNQDYNDTVIQAKMSDRSNTNRAEVTDFTMGNDSKPSTIEEDGEVIVTGPKTAEVGYIVTPGFDDYGDLVTVSEVRWMNGRQELATAEGPSGLLETDKLSPNKKYNGTFIEATMSDTSVTEKVDLEDFQANPPQTPTTVTEEGVVNVTSSTQATVSYQVNLGYDVNGEEVEIEKVSWMNGSVPLVSTDSKATTGTLTYNNFDYNQNYANTTIEVEVSDGTPVKAAEVAPFTTNPAVCIWPTVETDNFSADQKSASIEYDIYQGSDEKTNPYKIESIQWVEVGTDDAFENSKPVEDPNKNPNGKLTIDGLTPGSNYSESEILVTFKGTDEIRTTVKPFSTIDATVVPPTVTNSNFTIINQTGASVDYEINQGSDEREEEYVIESIQWVEVGTDDAFENSKPVKTPNRHPDGTLTIDGLTPGSNYPESEILVTFAGTADVRSPVANFSTPALDLVVPTITSSIDEGKTTSNSATFDYVATPGSDAHGEEYKLTKIIITDSSGHEFATKGNGKTSMDLSGSITANDLTAGETYSDWTMEATFVDSDKIPYEEDLISDEIDEFTTLFSDGENDDALFGIWTISGIIAGVILFIAIGSLLLTYFANKHHKNKI